MVVINDYLISERRDIIYQGRTHSVLNDQVWNPEFFKKAEYYHIILIMFGFQQFGVVVEALAPEFHVAHKNLLITFYFFHQSLSCLLHALV